ncbi:MAG: patatin-like phospholipase family protein [Limnochordales bacterium]|nr:patatin-like phospholipase family protein [Limnochordales bacterium]
MRLCSEPAGALPGTGAHSFVSPVTWPGPSSIGIALGGGAARGAAHVGVLRELERRGISIDVVAGTSIGALVGAAYAAGRLDQLEALARSLTWGKLLRLADPALDGGLVRGQRLDAVLQGLFGELKFEDLPQRLVLVAAALPDGDPVMLTSGRLAEAVRASMSVPGLFQPVWHQGRCLVDGGLVELLPVRAAKACGAEVVIGVDISSPNDIWGRLTEWMKHIYVRVARRPPRWGQPGSRNGSAGQAIGHLSLWQVVGHSLDVAVRSRETVPGDDEAQPDILIRPAVQTMHGHEFLRWAEGVQVGRTAVEEAWPRLSRLLGDASHSGTFTSRASLLRI